MFVSLGTILYSNCWKPFSFQYFDVFEYFFFCTQTVSVGSTSVERYNPAALKAIRLMKVENIVIVETRSVVFFQ